MGKIFFDLDGPILDNREKYYNIYRDLLNDSPQRLLEKEEYWRLKRMKTPERNILNGQFSGERILDYEKKRLLSIEIFDYLKQDVLQPEIIETISRWQNRHEIYLVTIRKNRKTLIRQLEYFGIVHLFRRIFSEDDNAGDWRVKQRLLSGEVHEPANCLIIGDTEADIEAGKALGIRTAAVTCGIRSREFLAALRPDCMFEFARDINPDSLFI